MFILMLESATQALADIKVIVKWKARGCSYAIWAADKSFFLHLVLPALHSFGAEVWEAWSCV